MASYFFYIATSSVNIDGSVGLSQPAGSVAASATARRSISLAISQPPSAFNAPAVAKRSGTIALS